MQLCGLPGDEARIGARWTEVIEVDGLPLLS